jgi:hypothetical protein
MRTSQRVDLPVGFRRRAARPSIATRVARAVDVTITRVQEWLEGSDRRCDLVAANLFVIAAVLLLAAAVVGMVIR